MAASSTRFLLLLFCTVSIASLLWMYYEDVSLDTVQSNADRVRRRIPTPPRPRISQKAAASLSRVRWAKEPLLTQRKQHLLENVHLRNTLHRIEEVASKFNSLSLMRNLENFPLGTQDELNFAILLLVHKRASYLNVMLNMLSRQPRISDVTLIVSYDGLFPEVSSVIDGIGFCRVKEIIYPWNRLWLDGIGNRTHRKTVLRALGLPPRNAGFLKHHLLWALNQAWEVVGRDDRGNPWIDEIIHLEDDIFLTTDFLSASMALSRLRNTECPECVGSSVGYHERKRYEREEGITADMTRYKCPVRTSIAALSHGRASWDRLKGVVHNFCVPNTRHWDDSLYLLHKPGCCEWNDSDPDFVFNTSQPILIDPLYLFSSIPRAVHAGECGGIHYRGELKAEDFHHRAGRNVMMETRWSRSRRRRYPNEYGPVVDGFAFRRPLKKKSRQLKMCRARHSKPGFDASRKRGSLDVPPTARQFCESLANSSSSTLAIRSVVVVAVVEGPSLRGPTSGIWQSALARRRSVEMILFQQSFSVLLANIKSFNCAASVHNKLWEVEREKV